MFAKNKCQEEFISKVMAECLADFDHLDEAPTNLRKIVE